MVVLLLVLFKAVPAAFAVGNIHIGAMEIRPFAAIEQKHDDNIFLEPNNQENDDWITTATLGLGVQMPIIAERGEDFMFKAKYSADVIEFWDESGQDRTDHNVWAIADFVFANDLTLKIEEDYEKTADPPNSELTSLQKRFRNSAGVVAGYAGEEISFD